MFCFSYGPFEVFDISFRFNNDGVITYGPFEVFDISFRFNNDGVIIDNG